MAYIAEKIEVVDERVVFVVNVVAGGDSGLNGKSAYQLAIESGFEGTEEEWLISLKGEEGYTPQKGTDYDDGDDGITPNIGGNGNWFLGAADTGVKAEGDAGKEVEFQKSATHVQWKYVSDLTWSDLIALSDLKGEEGDTPQKGTDYDDGDDGLTPTIGGNGNWFIGAVDTGVKAEGDAGKEVEFQKSATHIQWKYLTDLTWSNLVALSDLKGDQGSDADVESEILESNTVKFDKDYVIGNAAPRSGDILADFIGARLGATFVMRHNDSAVFTFPTSWKIISGQYSAGEDNYIWGVLTNKTPSSESVLVTFSKEN